MKRKTVTINRLCGQQTATTSFDSFKLFGHIFHVTISTDNENLFTITHEGTGFCIDVEKETITQAKNAGIQFLESKGKKKVCKVINRAKWFLWKQKHLPIKTKIKRWITYLFYVIVGLCAIVGSIIIGLYIGGNVTITL